MAEIRFQNVKGSRKIVVTEAATHLFFFRNLSGRLEIDIKKPGARVYLFGLYLGRGRDNFNLQTIQRHAMANTFSEVLIKGVFFDQARFSHRGLVRIEKKAPKSHAYQKNQNLLMSEKAFVESKPDLEILANDVFCTHASTTGRLDSEQLFFLRGRGLSQKQAEDLLVKGFLKEIFDKMTALDMRCPTDITCP